ncbi:hypothetical protein [Thalassobellus citreus]|uniref:hypothetical protein n=1 Tax=Thalassobellus citreus TaxID=3367752 RepID=UPI00379322A4
MKNLILLFVIALFLFNCSSSENDDTNTTPDPQPNAITYNGNIKSIINNNCTTCHGSLTTQGAPTSYVNYNQVKAAVNNIISRTNSSSNPMPPAPNAMLSQANRDLIQKWKDDGLLEK